MGLLGASQVALMVPANAGSIREVGLTPGSWKIPSSILHGNPLQCSCLENPMDRGAWWATFHRVAESQTRLKRLGTHCYLYTITEHYN